MNYVRNTWYVGAWTHELGDSGILPVTILGERIALFRTAQGQAVALEDRCVHRLAPLSMGRVEGDGLRCMYHGILFDASGKVVEIPGQDTIPAKARVRAYPLAERHGWVWVWMGDPARADEALIPALAGVGHPDYLLGTGHIDYAAEARLISENLLDFSHLSYVHANSFGLGAQFAETHASITPVEHGIRYERWMENLTKNAANQDAEPTDSFMSYDYLLPGILSMKVASYPVGTAKRLNYGVPDIADAVRDALSSSQAVTPMTDRSTRYYFCQGPHRKFGNEALLAAMMDVVARAFAEDKRMIEAQQQVIDGTPRPTVLATTHDRSVILFNRLVDQRVRAESGSALAEASA